MAKQTSDVTEQAYAVWLNDGNFTNVYPLFPNMPQPSVRRLVYEHRKAIGIAQGTNYKEPPPTPVLTYDDEAPTIDGREVWRRAAQLAERQLTRRRPPVAAFDYGPVCIVSTADWHLGSDGTDYARLEKELNIIADTPGMYVGFVGDALDNFIIGKLLSLRMHTSFKVTEEWAMVRYALGIIGPKLLYAVGGNHDAWTAGAAGIDYLADVVRAFAAVPYDANELTLEVQVGGASYMLRARHKWRLTSMLNPTHGIEQASRFDKGRGFDVGIGAHTHASGLSREFNNGGRTGIAQLCGAYKREDEFAKRQGFAQPNEATAVATIFTEAGMWGTSNLQLAADYMTALYKEDDHNN